MNALILVATLSWAIPPSSPASDADWDGFNAPDSKVCVDLTKKMKNMHSREDLKRLVAVAIGNTRFASTSSTVRVNGQSFNVSSSSAYSMGVKVPEPSGYSAQDFATPTIVPDKIKNQYRVANCAMPGQTNENPY